MLTFRDYLDRVKPSLEIAFERELSGLLGNIHARDRGSLMETLEAGKKIRGSLSCMVSETLGGTLEAAIPRATVVELIHAASLIHDDFVDQDVLRGNRPTAWTLEGARRAVLIGDVIFSSAIKMMNDLSREDGQAVIRAIVLVSRGALHEPLDPIALSKEIEDNKLTGQLYEKIIQLKTGILFGTACQLGAIAAEADNKLKEMSYRYGIRIGEAYQIADDVKEVEQHLLTRSIQPKQMAALVPAFLYFTDSLDGNILPLLQGKSTDLTGPTLEYFMAMLELMEKEVEHRLESAVSEIRNHFPDNAHGLLMQEAPWDIIRIFNAA